STLCPYTTLFRSDVLKAMEADSGLDIPELRVDGGATANDLLMQIQANLLQANVVRPKVTETTALGAAYFAGLATGFWEDVSSLEQQWQEDRQFAPDLAAEEAETLLAGWKKAIHATNSWTEK